MPEALALQSIAMSSIERFANPTRFLRFQKAVQPWVWVITISLFAVGLFLGLTQAPADYQQGETVRIMYVHVPAAWSALMVYSVMALASIVGIIFRHPLADIAAKAAAPIGMAFCFLALATGSLWGKPMWGAWWVWDARLTSELILLFLYLGVISLYGAIEDRRSAARAVAILALVGVVNIPIIHYSVEWWNTLHQGPTVTKFDAPSIDVRMLVPLLIMALAFKLFYIVNMLMRARCELLSRERNSRWVAELAEAEHG